MLFHITQVHRPENCPKDEGGADTLYSADAEGVTLRAMYGAFAEHTIHYVVEADDINAVNRFLFPGFKRCECKISAVSEETITR